MVAGQHEVKDPDEKDHVACDVIRYILSTGLSLTMLLVIVWGIGIGEAVLPGPPVVHYIIFIFCVILLAYLEGLQVAILALEGMSSDAFSEHYPRAAQLHDKVNEGKNVRRFLIGRQFFVIFVVYLTAQVTTFPDLPRLGIPDVIFFIFIQTGLPGALIVLAFGQLLAQLIAATHPVHILNLPGAMWVLYLTLGLEYSGVTHFSWLITTTAKRIFGLDKKNPMTLDTLRTEFGCNTVASSWLLNPNSTNLVISWKDVCESAARAKEEGVQVHIDSIELPQSGEGKAEKEWPATPRPEQYPTPQAIVESLVKAEKPVPRFLLPPYHPMHIPPHVVATSLIYRGQWNDEMDPSWMFNVGAAADPVAPIIHSCSPVSSTPEPSAPEPQGVAAGSGRMTC